ncbi:hypothetical protein DUZ99_05215 [Xylanibacillus composti]|uniref:Uncharacterized protein n=1 Tax=Xylanibacillus composti TaxID=1572762 RepID=A0A8J4GZ92_9BACL|nr:hypothetical protein [Xylanibacillus composti]MDT9724387.1 hypothetical protein [Xylanibacillus composti]GIQ67982.1 hypothetical protein XYCOK13_08060 [Xylanibacillus composti]
MKLAEYVRPAIDIQIPQGKRPGYYAQFVKELAGNACLYDRDKELLIAQDEHQLQDICRVVDRYAFPYEAMQVLELPGNSEFGRYADDYGFHSRSERMYLYLDHIYAFQLIGGEWTQARFQIDEYLLAAVHEEQSPIWIVPAEHQDLMTGIAKAYGCKLVPALT